MFFAYSEVNDENARNLSQSMEIRQLKMILNNNINQSIIDDFKRIDKQMK